MKSKKYSVPVGFSDWWYETFLREDHTVRISLKWRGDTTLRLGRLATARSCFEVESEFSLLRQAGVSTLDLADTVEDELASKAAKGLNAADSRDLGRALGAAFTRAGWLKPLLDPLALVRLLELRDSGKRIEFILDTNALVNGSAHWLLDIFADRCDLVLTPVTLRELQDVYDAATFSNRIFEQKNINRNNASSDNGKSSVSKDLDRLNRRQLYLAAKRLQERIGYGTAIWRELELEDVALLLSRGSSREKSSESDTLLLRAVRRSINDRVAGLERFFVTGDTALARRAASELPTGSLLTFQVTAVIANDILMPSAWWPGPDEGRFVRRDQARVIWELLCIGDEVILEDIDDGRCWSLTGFRDPMWPSDYTHPWINVTQVEQSINSSISSTVTSEKKENNVLGEPIVIEQAESSPVPSDVRTKAAVSFSPWMDYSDDAGTNPEKLRFGSQAALDLLAKIGVGSEQNAHLLDALKSRSSTNHLSRLLGLAGLGGLDDEGEVHGGETSSINRLASAWSANDLDSVFDLLSAWKPLFEISTRILEEELNASQKSARALASRLGQGFYHPMSRVWMPGGARPTFEVMRQAILHEVRDKGRGNTIPVYRLLVHVFGESLGVSPARAILKWDELWHNGVFDDFEPREGGSPSNRFTQDIAVLNSTGWSSTKFHLESVKGVRDIVYKGAIHDS